MGLVKIKRAIGVSIASLGMVAGMAGGIVGAQPGLSGIIGTTGPFSVNEITSRVWRNIDVRNINDLDILNENDQVSLTGFVEVFGNTTAGGAVTGDAVNENEFAAEVVVDNTGLGLLGVTNPIAPALINDGLPIVDAAITLTGPESYNAVTAITNTRLDICNNNSLVVTNLSTQDALTGDATVSHNTFGGSAISGDAINRSATGVSLTVAN